SPTGSIATPTSETASLPDFRRADILPIPSAPTPEPLIASTKMPTAPAAPTRPSRTDLQCRKEPSAHRSRSVPDQCRLSTPRRKHPRPNPRPCCPSVPSSTPALLSSLPIARTPAPMPSSFPNRQEESRRPLPVPCARQHRVPTAPATSQGSCAPLSRREPSPVACGTPRSPPRDGWLRRRPAPGRTSRLSSPNPPVTNPRPQRVSAGQSPCDNPCSAALSLPPYAAPPEFLPSSKPSAPPAPTASRSCTTTAGPDRFASHCETIHSPRAAPPPLRSPSPQACARLPERPCSANTLTNTRRSLATFSPQSACAPCSWKETAGASGSPCHPPGRCPGDPCSFPTLESRAFPAAESDGNSRSPTAPQNIDLRGGDTSDETACSCPRWDRSARHRRRPADPSSRKALSQSPSTAPATIAERRRALASRDLPGP